LSHKIASLDKALQRFTDPLKFQRLSGKNRTANKQAVPVHGQKIKDVTHDCYHDLDELKDVDVETHHISLYVRNGM